MFEDNIHNNKLCILGKLTASLIHEIRNPLSVIKLNLDFLTIVGSDLSAEISESVDSSKDAVERIQKLIDTINDFSRKNPKSESLSALNEITLKAISILKSTINHLNIKMFYELQENIPNLFLIKTNYFKLF
jgi:phosphoglycerate-specific signal transduction histidine kinase